MRRRLPLRGTARRRTGPVDGGAALFAETHPVQRTRLAVRKGASSRLRRQVCSSAVLVIEAGSPLAAARLAMTNLSGSAPGTLNSPLVPLHTGSVAG